MTIGVGERLPDATFKVATSEGLSDLSTNEVFAGKRVVLIGVPGAFTPTCNDAHLPGFIENRDAILAQGVDAIAVLSVNDGWVMAAWSRFTGAEDKLVFLPDGNGTFTTAIGLDADMSAPGYGRRCRRFSMIVEDGVVKALNIEPERGKVTQSGAAYILDQL